MRVRLLYIAALAGVWVVVAALGVEAFHRVRFAMDTARVAEFKTRHIGEMRARDAARIAAHYPDAPPKPSWAPSRVPDRRVFFQQDEAGRHAHCAERGEAVFAVRPDGRMDRVYLPENLPDFSAMLAGCGPGEGFDCLLPPDAAQDARDAVARAFQGEWTGTRFHHIPQPGREDPFSFELMVLPHSETPGSDGVVLAAVRPTKYARLAHSYRPHYYAHSDHDPIYPQFAESEFWTNALGFRGGEITQAKPDGTVRILCVGGSTTVEGPRNDLTYPSLLERHLARRFPGHAIEVVNCGVDAVGSYVESRRVDDFLALEPDVVVLYTFANDQLPILTQFREARQQELPWWAPAAGLSRFLEERLRRRELPTPDAIAPFIQSHTFQSLGVTVEALRARGVRVAVASLARPALENLPRMERQSFDPRYGPVIWGVESNEIVMTLIDTFNALLKDFCAREGVLHIPVAERLHGGADLFADVVHLFLPGIERKAEIVYEALEPVVAELLGEDAAARRGV